MNPQAPAWRAAMQALYDSYFDSQDYDRRYPRPNPGTLAFLLRHGAGQAASVLDFGCGNGRYALPLLAAGAGRLVGCDISQAAIAQFAQRLQDHPARDRVQLVAGSQDDLPAAARFDRILLLFGVLSHLGPRAARIASLRALRQRLVPGGLLLLSVPSAWRRRPGAFLRSALCERGPDPGDIRFDRCIAGREQTFLYHLYSLRGLREELRAAGWQLVACEPESVLPEWLVTQSAACGRIDRALQRMLPAALGYGIRAVARAGDDGA